jgi:hypothetical protein
MATWKLSVGLLLPNFSIRKGHAPYDTFLCLFVSYIHI